MRLYKYELFKTISRVSLAFLLAFGLSIGHASAQVTNSYPCGPDTSGSWGYCGVISGGFSYLDGPMGSPATTFSGSSLTLTTPSITWVVFGLPVASNTTQLTVAPSTTTYAFINQQDGTFFISTTNSAPSGFYELAYTIVATGTGISSVTAAESQALLVVASVGNQVATCIDACVLTLASGTVTWTFQTGLFTSTPVCTGTPITAPASGTPEIYVNAVSNTAVTFKSTLGSDARNIGAICRGNPN